MLALPDTDDNGVIYKSLHFTPPVSVTSRHHITLLTTSPKRGPQLFPHISLVSHKTTCMKDLVSIKVITVRRDNKISLIPTTSRPGVMILFNQRII